MPGAENEKNIRELLKRGDLYKTPSKVIRILQKDPEKFDELLDTLKDENPNVRSIAAWCLGAFKDPRAVDSLIIALKDTDSGVRAHAARGLGLIKDESVVGLLIKRLQDVDDYVRYLAAEALGSIGDPKAVKPLIEALYDEEDLVRETVLDSLGFIGDERAIPAIHKLLEIEGSEIVLNAAYKALERLRATKIVKSAESATENLDKLRGDADISASVSVKISEIIDPLKEDLEKYREERDQELQTFKDILRDIEEKSPELKYGLPYFKEMLKTKMELYDAKLSGLEKQITGYIEGRKHQESLFWVKIGVFVAVISIIISISIAVVSPYFVFTPPSP